jgi:hypothetical protein
VSRWFQIVRAVALVMFLGTCADFVTCSLLLDGCLSLPSAQSGSQLTTNRPIDDHDCLCDTPVIPIHPALFTVTMLVKSAQSTHQPSPLRAELHPPERPPRS